MKELYPTARLLLRPGPSDIRIHVLKALTDTGIKALHWVETLRITKDGS